MSEQGHACPHDGITYSGWDCGTRGQLCDLCESDKADARTDRLVEGLALAGLVANPEAQHATGTKRELCEHASLYAAALREREGGE